MMPILSGGREGRPDSSDPTLVFDWDLPCGQSFRIFGWAGQGIIAARFHNTLAEAIVEIAVRLGNPGLC